MSKGAKGGVTTADVQVVDAESRVAEIARMLGGDPESDVSRAHARELLEAAAVPAVPAVPADAETTADTGTGKRRGGQRVR